MNTDYFSLVSSYARERVTSPPRELAEAPNARDDDRPTLPGEQRHE
jgi:hypothetical protein